MEGFQKVKHVVVDSGAFIKNAPIQSIGESVYTLPEVVGEIRDRATRERLQVLPYTLNFKEPSLEAIRFVTEFSKKTGDYRSLSAVDLKVIALTYQLEKEFVGTQHIRETPKRKAEVVTGRKLVENPAEIAGFYLDKKDKITADESSKTEEKSDIIQVGSSCTNPGNTDTAAVVLKPLEHLRLGDTDSGCGHQSLQCPTPFGTKENCIEEDENCKAFSETTETEVSPCRWPVEGGRLSPGLLEEGVDTNSDDSDVESDDDDGGWITPSNIKAMKEKLGDVNTEKATVTVGCLTTDFSMQNVMIQMGLNIVSVNGMLIRRARSYALRCFACMKITSILTKQFCPKCGNDTLQKVSMTVDEDGTVKYFLSKRKPVTTRGLRYSLPAPKGGKHGNNPILCEDQPCPQQRSAKKAQQNLNVFDPDYIANHSPFALNDTTSRAAQLGIRQKGAWNKRNANVGKKKSGRRK